MRWFRMNKHKHKRKLPPLFKCISCEHRPGEVMHEGLPLCTSCATDLHRAIERYGSAIIQGVDALRAAQQSGVDVGPDAAAAIIERLMHHVSQLVKYEEKRLKTIDPSPTTLLHLLRTGEVADVNIHLYLPE